MTGDFTIERAKGLVLGAAIGDAMGHPTEFLKSWDAIHERFGPDGVTKYELYWTREGKRFAPYTDDTQMAELVLRTLVWSRKQDADLDRTMNYMSKAFVLWAYKPQGGHRAPGNACMAGCRALATGAAWHEAGLPAAGGCGSVMRAYPFGLIFKDDVQRAEEWAVAHSKLTHGAPIALAACAAMARAVSSVLADEEPAGVLRTMVGAAEHYDAQTAEMIERAVEEADNGTQPTITLQRLQGWAAHEAIAAAAYIFARHPDDPRAAILEGANTPGDSDSIATLAGALVSARNGFAALPADWVADLERTDELQTLAEQAAA